MVVALAVVASEVAAALAAVALAEAVAEAGNSNSIQMDRVFLTSEVVYNCERNRVTYGLF